MRIDPAEVSLAELYGWMLNTIVPRPIAWVSSISAEGVTNLAPFSFFQGVTVNPPTLLFSVVNNRHGDKKDTIRNIEAVPEFVVNVVTYELREQMNRSSALLPYGESEFAFAGVTAAPSELVRPPRVAESPVAFECKLRQIVRVGDGPLAANVVFGTVALIHINNLILDAQGRLDPGKLDAIARMGGDWYARTTDRFVLKRPGR
jgi:flavin reductase (DIM6/NTAB) family NADH-FMN oxidoreductase RutF